MRRFHICSFSLLALLVVGCTPTPAPVEDEAQVHPGTAVTLWTDQSELFFEYPPMVAGQASEPWAIHVTRLSDFSPITEGALTLAFQAEDGRVYTTRSETPTRPGIYTPAPHLPSSGTYRLVVDVAGSQLLDRIPAGSVEVFADDASIPHEEEAPDDGSIGFLKEQQWPIAFSVARVDTREIPEVISVSGEIIPAEGRRVSVTAPVSGLATAAGLNLNGPVTGSPVRSGQTLAVLAPTAQDNSFARARASVERLERDVARLERLYEVEAVAETRLIEARHDLEIAQASLDAIGSAEGVGYSFQVRAPISGHIQSRDFIPGQRVEAGDPLFEIVDGRTVWLRLAVPGHLVADLADPGAAFFTVEGSREPFRAGRLIAIGSALDSETRTLPVVLEVNNADQRLKIGQFASAGLEVGGSTRGPVVPNEAILNEDGQSVIYVQVGGERFERRGFVAGPTNGYHTIAVSGVAEGEYVVVQGAYQVYLASLSTTDIADHGHPH